MKRDDLIVRLRGLPWQATEEDVRSFFPDVQIPKERAGARCVHIVMNAQGRPTGEAFVRFGKEEEVLRALSRDRELMGQRYIEVFRSSRVELERAQQRHPSSLQDDLGKPLIRMRGLPFKATSEEVSGFFEQAGAKPIAVHILSNADGRAIGEAYAEFNSEDEGRRAMQKHKQQLGGRYIEIFRASRQELSAVLAEQRHLLQQRSYAAAATANAYYYAESTHPNRAIVERRGHESSALLRIRGTVQLSEDEIAAWLWEGAAVRPVMLHVLPEPPLRPPGEAFIEFATFQDRARALALHRSLLPSGRSVELFSASQQELLLSLSASHRSHFHSYSDAGAAVDTVQRSGSTMVHSPLEGLLHAPWPPAPSTAPDTIPPAPNAVPRAAARDHRARDEVVPAVQGLTLRMKGVPYRASTAEIVDFFRGFDVLPESVRFGQDADGRSSGECWVTFRTSEEGHRALREKNRGHIGSRYIELFIT